MKMFCPFQKKYCFFLQDGIFVKIRKIPIQEQFDLIKDLKWVEVDDHGNILCSEK